MLMSSGCSEEIKIYTDTYSDGKLKEEYQYYNHHKNNSIIKSGHLYVEREYRDGKE